MIFYVESLIGTWQTQQEWSLGGPLQKLFKWFWLVAQIGHWVKKVGFQNTIFKKFLVWNYKAQSFHIWCLTSSWGPIPIFDGQYKWSSVNGSTMNVDLFSQVSDPGPFGCSCLLIKKHTFTKFATAIQTKKQTTRTTAKVLYNNVILHPRIPTVLRSMTTLWIRNRARDV